MVYDFYVYCLNSRIVFFDPQGLIVPTQIAVAIAAAALIIKAYKAYLSLKEQKPLWEIQKQILDELKRIDDIIAEIENNNKICFVDKEDAILDLIRIKEKLIKINLNIILMIAKS